MHISFAWLRHMTVVGLMMLGLLALAPASQAQTADGATPAQETVCDGQMGALWGLCVAYCEAMDCHLEFPHAAGTACERVFTNYMKLSMKLFHYEAKPPCLCEQSESSAETLEEEDGGFDNCPSTPPAH
jgi:hypothetical protein